MAVSGYHCWADITNTFGHHLGITMNDTQIENCLLFTILRPFGTRESIRRKVDHGGQINNVILLVFPFVWPWWICMHQFNKM
jgi:hypothetical protein